MRFLTRRFLRGLRLTSIQSVLFPCKRQSFQQHSVTIYRRESSSSVIRALLVVPAPYISCLGILSVHIDAGSSAALSPRRTDRPSLAVYNATLSLRAIAASTPLDLSLVPTPTPVFQPSLVTQLVPAPQPRVLAEAYTIMREAMLTEVASCSRNSHISKSQDGLCLRMISYIVSGCTVVEATAIGLS